MTALDVPLPAFRCPRCKSPVAQQEQPTAYRCATCARDYPIILGIPDFRVWPDPYISAEDDWAKGARVLAEAGPEGFRAVVERYWQLTPSTPATLAARFVRYALVGVERGRTRLHRIQEIRGKRLSRSDTLLDLGCGAGGLVVAAAGEAGLVVGVDIAARWLAVARRRLEEANVRNAILVCACAEHLPFDDGLFSVVVANDVLEHGLAQGQLLQEARRALRPDGLLLLTTQNRWSLLGEPHVRVWGVGFLPRRWMARYVRLIRGVPYRFIRLVSPFELERLLRSAGFRTTRRLLPGMSPMEVAGLGTAERRLVSLYHWLARMLPFKLLLMLFGPAIEIAACPESVGDGVEPVSRHARVIQ
jgi:SAM-dependent methyltransferase